MTRFRRGPLAIVLLATGLLVAVAPAFAASRAVSAVVLNPLVRLVKPSAAAYLSRGESGGQATWAATALAQGGRRIVRVELLAADAAFGGAVVIATDAAAPFGGTVATGPLPHPVYLFVRATDSAGGIGYSSRSRWMTVISPALDDAWLSALPPLRVGTTTSLLVRPIQVPGIAITDVTWDIDASAFPVASAAPWVVEWTAPASAEDDTPYQAILHDAAGSLVHVGGTLDVIDDGASATISSPADLEQVAGAISVEVEATPAIGLADVVRILVDGVEHASATGTGSVSWETRSVDDGTHVVHALIDRSVGIDVISAGTIVDVANLDEPRVSMVMSPATTTVRGPTVTITAAIEDVGDDPVVGLIAEVGSFEVGRRDSTNLGTPISWNTRLFPDGVYRVRVIVELASGRILRTADRLVSLVNIRTWVRRPLSGSTVAGTTVKLEAGVTTDAESSVYKVSYFIDGVLVGTSRNTSMFWDSTSVANGTHSVVIRTVLSDGRTMATAPKSFEVSN